MEFKMGGIWPPGGPTDPERKAPSIQQLLKIARMPLLALLCGRCDHCDKHWNFAFEPMRPNKYEEKSGGPIDYSKLTNKDMICKLKDEVIGYKTEDEKLVITGRGVPHNCPFYLEYLVYTEGRQEARKVMTDLEKVMDTLKSRRDLKHRSC